MEPHCRKKIEGKMKKSAVVLLGLILALGCQATDKPNIVFILTDDQGYGDLGCFGSKVIATPNIDRLCARGMKFTSFYVHNRCSPTRAAFMTGCHARRTGVDNVVYRYEHNGLNPDEITVAEQLKKAGSTSRRTSGKPPIFQQNIRRRSENSRK